MITDGNVADFLSITTKITNLTIITKQLTKTFIALVVHIPLQSIMWNCQIKAASRLFSSTYIYQLVTKLRLI